MCGVELDTPMTVRYIRYSFGAASSDWSGVGSSLSKLHAMGPWDEGDEPPSEQALARVRGLGRLGVVHSVERAHLLGLLGLLRLLRLPL